MRILPVLAATLTVALSGYRARAGELRFQSPPGQRASLVELYTSEGCSSCPPADAWLGKLVASPKLWTEIVPVAFHVDYWNSLGWRDRFSSAALTARQQGYAAAWNSSSVYTPGLVLDGREWRGWSGFAPGERPAAETGGAGQLSAVVSDGKTVAVTYQPAGQPGAAREAYVALLGCGLESRVKAGENQGRSLRHDFVALACEHHPLLAGKEGRLAAAFTLPAPAAADAKRLALAVWVEAEGRAGVAQAAGGWLAESKP